MDLEARWAWLSLMLRRKNSHLELDSIIIMMIPLEWSRIESGSLSPWKHVWILFYAYFFFRVGPLKFMKFILRPCLIIFALSRVQGHPPYDACESWSLQILFWTIWNIILDSILDHSGNVFCWHCWRSCGFLRTKESKDTKENQEIKWANILSHALCYHGRAPGFYSVCCWNVFQRGLTW